MKRIFSIILAVAMVATVFTVTSSAAGETAVFYSWCSGGAFAGRSNETDGAITSPTAELGLGRTFVATGWALHVLGVKGFETRINDGEWTAVADTDVNWAASSTAASDHPEFAALNPTPAYNISFAGTESLAIGIHTVALRMVANNDSTVEIFNGEITYTEVVRYNIDSGAVGLGGTGGINTSGSLTSGSGTVLLGNNLPIGGWALSTSGVVDYQYKVDSGVFQAFPEDYKALAARPDVHRSFPEFDAAINATPGFSLLIPATVWAADGEVHEVSVRAVTANRNYYTFLVMTVTAVAPGDGPIPAASYGNSNHTSKDAMYIETQSGVRTNITTEAKDAVTINRGVHKHINFWGWFGANGVDLYGANPDSTSKGSTDYSAPFGYRFNEGTITYDEGFDKDDPSINDRTGFTYDTRMSFNVDLLGLTEGQHKLEVIARMADGAELIIWTVTITVNPFVYTESVPTTVDFATVVNVANNNFDFDSDATFVEGFSITTATSAANPFRRHWTPDVAAAGEGSNVIKVDANSNKYVEFKGFSQYYSDYRWLGGFNFSADVFGTHNALAQGIFVNFSREGGKAVSGSTSNLYEHNDVLDGTSAQLTGGSGMLVYMKDDTTIEIVVMTHDTETASKCNAIYAPITVPAGLSASWQSIDICDNGTDTIYVVLNGTTIAKVTYADAGTYDDGLTSVYYESYYKTVAILGADNSVLASTTSGLLSKYKTVAFAMRTGTLSVDNIAFAPYSEPIPPSPTDITIKDAGAAYFATVIRTGIARSTVLVARCTNPARGVVRAQLLSYLNDADYIRVYDKNGVLVSSAGARVETGWTVQLVDAAGNAVEGKSYKVAILGDVDADGRVTATDYSSATEASLDSNELTNEVYAAANIDNDRRLTPYDASAISLFVATSTW